jgi:hypothetical protein
MKEGSIFDQWLPKMTDHFSADGFAALEEIKEFIRSNVSTAALEECWFAANQSQWRLCDLLLRAGRGCWPGGNAGKPSYRRRYRGSWYRGERLAEIESHEAGCAWVRSSIQVFNSLGSFAAHLLTVEADVKLACDAAVVKAIKIVSKTAKNMIGHEQPFWPALQPETIERKDHGNTPLLETGELRDLRQSMQEKQLAMLAPTIPKGNGMNAARSTSRQGRF